MANRTASLVRYAKLEGLGWRRGSLTETKNHRHNPAAMIYDGVEYNIPADSHYHIRHYKDGQTVFTPAGRDYEAACSLLAKYDASRTLEQSQKDLGIYVPETKQQRKTLAEQLAAYLTKKRSPLLKLSKASIHVYESTLTGFVSHCACQFATDVTEEHVLAYLEHMKAAGYAPKVWTKQSDGSKVIVDGPRKGYSDKSITIRYVCIRGFLRSCGVDVDQVIETDIHKRLSAKPEANTEPYTNLQITRLLLASDDYHGNVFVFLLGTGLREQEAAHLKWENVDFERNEIIVVGTNLRKDGSIAQQTKNRKSRKVTMFASVRAQLLAWRAKNPDTIYVFGSRRSDMPSNHWLEYLKKYWNAAGLGDASEAYLHKFRHTFARKALDAGVAIDLVSKALGHHSVAVTQIYCSGSKVTHIDPFAAIVTAT